MMMIKTRMKGGGAEEEQKARKRRMHEWEMN